MKTRSPKAGGGPRRHLEAVGAALVLVAVTLVIVASPSSADHRLPNRGHWDDNGGLPHVKFLDYTGDPWPVGTSHLDWDQAYNIDVDWETADSSSTCGSDCVRVRTRAAADDPYFGPNCTGFAGYWTNYAPNQANHWGTGNEVRFNRSCNDRPARDRRSLTCQELGHALGLDHATVTSSCMFQDASRASTTPRQHDYDMLNLNIYNHND